MANFIHTLTKDQVLHVYAGLTEVPKNDGKVVFPIPSEAVSIHITVAPHKSTYGKTLYRCEHIPTTERQQRLDAISVLIGIRRNFDLDDAQWEKNSRIANYLLDSLHPVPGSLTRNGNPV